MYMWVLLLFNVCVFIHKCGFSLRNHDCFVNSFQCIWLCFYLCNGLVIERLVF